MSAVFSDLPALPWFEEQGIYPDENGELLISRQISADGKNVCRVSGLPCTVMQLRGLGQQLINIHGQHDAQQLLDEGSHLAYLDSFGALFPLLEEYQRAYRALMELRHKMESLTMDEAEKSRTIDTLNFQIRELERAELREGEEEELAEEKMLLQSGGKLMDALARASLALLGDDDQLGAVALLGDAAKALMPVSGLHTEMEQTAESISELHFQADDLAEQIRSMLDQFDFSPEALDRVEERLDILYRLKKKYGATVEEMLAYLERCREDLDNIELSADLLLRLEAEYATQEALALGLAQNFPTRALTRRRAFAFELRRNSRSWTCQRCVFVRKSPQEKLNSPWINMGWIKCSFSCPRTLERRSNPSKRSLRAESLRGLCWRSNTFSPKTTASRH